MKIYSPPLGGGFLDVQSSSYPADLKCSPEFKFLPVEGMLKVRKRTESGGKVWGKKRWVQPVACIYTRELHYQPKTSACTQTARGQHFGSGVKFPDNKACLGTF